MRPAVSAVDRAWLHMLMLMLMLMLCWRQQNKLSERSHHRQSGSWRSSLPTRLLRRTLRTHRQPKPPPRRLCKVCCVLDSYPPSAVQPYRTRCPCSGDTGRAAEGHADGRWTDDDDGRCDTCGRRPQALPGSGTRCTATSACPDTRAATVANATSHSRPRSEAALSGVPCRRTGSCAGHSPASPACASGCASSDTCAGHCQPSEPNSNSAHPWSRAHGHRDGCQG